MKRNSIPVVDLFAGPGGLGEGFSALNDGKSFHIVVSAEKDPVAHLTLRLRAFYRLLRSERPELLSDYYSYCHGETTQPYSETSDDLWKKAGKEALCIELGTEEGNSALDQAITGALRSEPDKNTPWVLIGGPPCQAYSLVGRARNRGNAEYKAEADPRHFLYKEYLRIIQRYKPALFVMENVKGLLSAKVNGSLIFHEILRDLACPERAIEGVSDGVRYKIFSMVSDQSFSADDDPAKLDANSFIIRAEEYGIPQARHRVILVGVREDQVSGAMPNLVKQAVVSVEDAIDVLPKLRSRLSKQPDSPKLWAGNVGKLLDELATSADDYAMQDIATCLRQASANLLKCSEHGANIYPKKYDAETGSEQLDTWLMDKNLSVWLNHESRSHRIDDLGRYAYAAVFAELRAKSPKGHAEFMLPGLAPAHKNWESGKFSDRFRVQTRNGPATTITSHISKDGHYFIHYDPAQCRSLTVREAARLQTFPDNYFFQGPRTDQFHQVGNAVPPYLANQIAAIVLDYINGVEEV
ncbi:MAG: DNA cytosine methyltransferase [Gammaproteobacteria bacterium]|nr:DNA cytosine methyltransferase [Gammaproteobacteria bacterium]MBU2056592.1 DNA cytosine methyltransferase [Gammaproteobacteria bacterium]MBU2173609.1 DNA cytosine methyltransferase [Gammaproteobacteria bacterium]MBU2247390.1 DNA cytosine methyltransferase [Gammaproteobacteria bacterium]MBU2682130.1 DNA cytosine methyltransferase [Gammaproteobacteria bacterium]